MNRISAWVLRHPKIALLLLVLLTLWVGVQDRKTKKPNREAAAKIVFRAWELGLVCYYAGMWGSVIELTPPLILTRAEIDEGVDILAQATRDYLEGDIPDKAIAPYAGW